MDFGSVLHPDHNFADYIMRGIRDGVRLDFSYSTHRCKPAHSNMRSALTQPKVVCEYLAKECVEGRVIGPLEPALHPMVHISWIGVISKKSTGKWYLIVDLSSPEGFSANDGTEEGLCSLSYISLDHAV